MSEAQDAQRQEAWVRSALLRARRILDRAYHELSKTGDHAAYAEAQREAKQIATAARKGMDTK